MLSLVILVEETLPVSKCQEINVPVNANKLLAALTMFGMTLTFMVFIQQAFFLFK